MALPDFGLLDSSAVNKYFFCFVLSSRSCGNLLQQFQETNTSNNNLIFPWITIPSLFFTPVFLIENDFYTLVPRSGAFDQS